MLKIAILAITVLSVQKVHSSIIELEVTYDSKFNLGLDSKELDLSFVPISYRLLIDLTYNESQSYYGHSPFGGNSAITGFDYLSVSDSPYSGSLKSNISPSLNDYFNSKIRISEDENNSSRSINFYWQEDGFLNQGEDNISSFYQLDVSKTSQLKTNELKQYPTEYELFTLLENELVFSVAERSFIQIADSNLNITDIYGIEYSGYAKFLSPNPIKVSEPSSLITFILMLTCGLYIRNKATSNRSLKYKYTRI